VTENENSRLRGILLMIGGLLIGGGLMLGAMAAKWPTECTVKLSDKFGVRHEYLVKCGE